MALVFGSAVHKGIEDFYGGKPNTFLEDFKRKDITKKEDQPEADFLQEFAEHKELGMKLLTDFVDRQSWLEHVYGISPRGVSEQKFEIEAKNPSTNEPLGLNLKGTYDRITSTGGILEFKTSKKPYKKDDLDEKPQSWFYPLSFFLERHAIPESFSYIVLLKQRKKEPVQVLQKKLTSDDIDMAFRRLKGVVMQLKMRNWVRGNGRFENNCDCVRFSKLFGKP